MKTYNAEQLIKQLQEQTEQILNIAMQWQMINPTVFKQQPVPGAWSAMQCLGHLNAYGVYYLPAIEKAIIKAKQNNKSSEIIFSSGWLGSYFTRLMMPDKNGIPSKKMKAPKNYTINNASNSDVIIAEFIEQQEKLLLLLEDAGNVNLNKIRIPVSIARFIKLKLGDVFMFLIAHNLRHIKQAEKAIAVAQSLQSKAITVSIKHT